MVWWISDNTTYNNHDLSSMLMLHKITVTNSTSCTEDFIQSSLNVAKSTLPNLYQYGNKEGCFCNLNHTGFNWQSPCSCPPRNYYEWQSFEVKITSTCAEVGFWIGCETVGHFDRTNVLFWQNVEAVSTTILVLIIWLVFKVKFTKPVQTLVVQPIEGMIQLLSILSRDSVGYQNTLAYENFLVEEKEKIDSSDFSKEVLDEMET